MASADPAASTTSERSVQSDRAERTDRPPLLAIAMLSAATLGYEILLMRLFSVIQWHHFAYMMISVALLGYGAAGTGLSVCLRGTRSPRPLAPAPGGAGLSHPSAATF